MRSQKWVGLAGTGAGVTFNLGKINTVDAVSTLVGNVERHGPESAP